MTNELNEVIVDAIDDTRNNRDVEISTITPYAAHTAVNAMLKINGFDNRIPPQMMYNYRTSKYCPFEVTSNGEFTTESFKKWLSKYINKKIAKRDSE